jgi:hypothetical protein
VNYVVILENSSGLKECRNIRVHIDWRMIDFYECSENNLKSARFERVPISPVLSFSSQGVGSDRIKLA